jgi:hypothetical protein
VNKTLVFIFWKMKMLQGYSLSSVSICHSKKSLCIVYNDLGSKLVVILQPYCWDFFSGLLLAVWDTGMWPRLSETWKYVESKRMFHDQGIFLFSGRMILLELLCCESVSQETVVSTCYSSHCIKKFSCRQCPLITEKTLCVIWCFVMKQ